MSGEETDQERSFGNKVLKLTKSDKDRPEFVEVKFKELDNRVIARPRYQRINGE